MKILVPMKSVPDSKDDIRVLADGSGVDTSRLTYVINPFCHIAIEEALRLKKVTENTEVVLVCIGPETARKTIISALGMGADRAVHVVTELKLDPSFVADILSEIVRLESPALVILGKQAVDGDAGQTGPRLAALLGWPQATFASEVRLSDNGRAFEVVREVDGGLETVAFDLPGIITTDLRLNKPRIPNLRLMQQARQRELRQMSIEDFSLSPEPRVTSLGFTPPPTRKPGRMVKNVEELVRLLHEEAGVV